MQAHSHIFIPSIKKDVSFCSICSKLSYKEIPSNALSLQSSIRFNLDPLTMKFKPIASICNHKSENNIKYIKNKIKAIIKLKYLTINFGLKSMLFYKALNLVNQIFLENDLPIDIIDSVASVCLLLVVEYNECCVPSVLEENLTKDEKALLYINNTVKEGTRHKSNLRGLFSYIKKNVYNYNILEVLCLKYLNYDLGRYSAYDYLLLFFGLGIFFSEEKVNIKDKLKYCINILDLIIYDEKFCDFSQYTFAMSIIKITLENDCLFDKKIFKHIYGVDLSKSKYVKCSNLIKKILDKSINEYINKNFFNIWNNLLYLYNQRKFSNKSKGKEIHEEEKNENNENNANITYKYDKSLNADKLNDNHIIITNNNNFDINNLTNYCSYNNYFKCIDNNFNFNLYNNDNNNFFLNKNNQDNYCNKNFQSK